MSHPVLDFYKISGKITVVRFLTKKKGVAVMNAARILDLSKDRLSSCLREIKSRRQANRLLFRTFYRDYLEEGKRRIQLRMEKEPALLWYLQSQSQVIQNLRSDKTTADEIFNHLYSHPRVRALAVNQEGLLIYLQPVVVEDWPPANFCLGVAQSEESLFFLEWLRSDPSLIRPHRYWGSLDDTRSHSYHCFCFGGADRELITLAEICQFYSFVSVAWRLLTEG